MLRREIGVGSLGCQRLFEFYIGRGAGALFAPKESRRRSRFSNWNPFFGDTSVHFIGLRLCFDVGLEESARS